jgi:DNA-directed RNA polymerase subunit M/transcription elongation factor TFIIS
MKIYIKAQANVTDLKDQLRSAWLDYTEKEKEMALLALSIKDAIGDRDPKISALCSAVFSSSSANDIRANKMRINVADLINEINKRPRAEWVTAQQMVDRPPVEPKKKRRHKCPKCKGDASLYEDPIRTELDVVDCPECGKQYFSRKP